LLDDATPLSCPLARHTLHHRRLDGFRQGAGKANEELGQGLAPLNIGDIWSETQPLLNARPSYVPQQESYSRCRIMCNARRYQDGTEQPVSV
jgi:hypothetical protein